MSALPSAEEELRKRARALVALPDTEQADERNRMLVFFDGALFPPGTVDAYIADAEQEAARRNGKAGRRSGSTVAAV